MKLEVGQIRQWARHEDARGYLPRHVCGKVFLVIGDELYCDGMYRTPVLGHGGMREFWATKFMTEFSEVIDETR